MAVFAVSARKAPETSPSTNLLDQVFRAPEADLPITFKLQKEDLACANEHEFQNSLRKLASQVPEFIPTTTALKTILEKVQYYHRRFDHDSFPILEALIPATLNEEVTEVLRKIPEEEREFSRKTIAQAIRYIRERTRQSINLKGAIFAIQRRDDVRDLEIIQKFVEGLAANEITLSSEESIGISKAITKNLTHIIEQYCSDLTSTPKIAQFIDAFHRLGFVLDTEKTALTMKLYKSVLAQVTSKDHVVVKAFEEHGMWKVTHNVDLAHHLILEAQKRDVISEKEARKLSEDLFSSFFNASLNFITHSQGIVFVPSVIQELRRIRQATGGAVPLEALTRLEAAIITKTQQHLEERQIATISGSENREHSHLFVYAHAIHAKEFLEKLEVTLDAHITEKLEQDTRVWLNRALRKIRTNPHHSQKQAGKLEHAITATDSLFPLYINEWSRVAEDEHTPWKRLYYLLAPESQSGWRYFAELFYSHNFFEKIDYRRSTQFPYISHSLGELRSNLKTELPLLD